MHSNESESGLPDEAEQECIVFFLLRDRRELNSKTLIAAYNNISDICRSDAMRICELREKEVINTCDCKVLGCVVDIDFDLCSGQIEAIIVPGPGKVCGIFGVDSEYIIPFACIRKIGPDIILVEIQKEKFLKKI